MRVPPIFQNGDRIGCSVERLSFKSAKQCKAVEHGWEPKIPKTFPNVKRDFITREDTVVIAPRWQCERSLAFELSVLNQIHL